MLGAEPAQLALAGGDLRLELVEQAQARLDGAAPGLGQEDPLEERAPTRAEEVGDGTGRPEGDQGLMDAVLERGPVASEMETKAGPLALGAYGGSGKPDGGHELAPAELRQHPGVDAVGLAGKGSEALDPERVCDHDLPTLPLELVVDETRSVHRLDRRPHRLAVASETQGERAQTVAVGRRRAPLEGRAGVVDETEIEALATEIQTGVQH